MARATVILCSLPACIICCCWIDTLFGVGRGRIRERELVRGEKLKAKEASFREAREKMLEDLERRVKGAKAALGEASATLKEEKRAAQVSFIFESEPVVVICRKLRGL